MVNLKIFPTFEFQKYFYLVFISNFLAILFLNDTTSFNLGLLSIQSLFYSINKLIFIFFISFETIAAFLDYYGLTFNFIKLIITDIKNLNSAFNIYILFENSKYIFFFVLNISFLIFSETLIKLIINNKKLLFLSFIFLIILSTLITFTVKNTKYMDVMYQRSLDKINYVFNGNFFRNDNWFNVSKNTIRYNDNNKKFSNFSFGKTFKDYNEFQNIFVIINESYPNFKDKNLKNKLAYALESNLQNIKISKYKKDWNKNYSTQGAEMDFYCDKKGTWEEFKNDFNNFLTKNDCWINNFKNRNNIFIHSYNSKSFNRTRYYLEDNSFFNEAYFKEDLLKLKYNTCETNFYYIGICESEIVKKLLNKIKKNKKKQFVLYLTVENHIPVHVKNYEDNICKNYPLNLHPQFCTLFHNQLNFNKEINKFLNTLNSNDLLVLFSDTPPLLSQRDRIHFEDYIDVIFFTKKF
tara:strand:- start:1998 stop:3392 length:1395 start_codon:yes stop_codon:yes gene_type:complete